MVDGKIDIFIRSYDNDVKFLDLMLKSYKKNGKGYGDVVIVGDGVTDGSVRALAEKHNIRYVRDDSGQIPTGYIAQQYSKLNAPKYLDGQYIIYIDSDCVFAEEHSVEEWFCDDKPIMLWDEWHDVGDAICWKRSTELITHRNAPYEFMRRFPLLYPREVIEGCAEYLDKSHGSLLELFQKMREVSEFNVLGNYAWHFHKDKFTWLNGRENAANSKCPIKQYFSHTEYEKARSEYEV